MTDTRLLRAKMTLKGITYKELAHMIGISLNSLTQKINGTRQFKQQEISKIQKMLGLTDEEVVHIFLV